MSNFIDSLAMDENFSTSWLSNFTRKAILVVQYTKDHFSIPSSPWLRGRNIADYVVDLYNFNKFPTAETRCFSTDSIQISDDLVL